MDSAALLAQSCVLGF